MVVLQNTQTTSQSSSPARCRPCLRILAIFRSAALDEAAFFLSFFSLSVLFLSRRFFTLGKWVYLPSVYEERQADGKEACFVMCDDQGTLFVPGRRRTHHARRCTSKEKFLKFSRNERDSTIFVSRLISFPFVQARDNFSASKMKRSSIKRTASSE